MYDKHDVGGQLDLKQRAYVLGHPLDTSTSWARRCHL